MSYYCIDAAKNATVDFCRSQYPRTRIQIAEHLKQKVPGFFVKTPSKQLAATIEQKILTPLETRGLIVCYSAEDAYWPKVAGLLKHHARTKNHNAPRRVEKAYHINFLYLSGDSVFPTIQLPKPDKEMNLDLVVMLGRYTLPENYTWELMNLLVASANKQDKDQLRLFLYSLPLDYNEIDQFEKVLEFGKEFNALKFPFKAHPAAAKEFLIKLAKAERYQK